VNTLHLHYKEVPVSIV